MKSLKPYFILIFFLLFLFPTVSFARDTDIYMATGQGVEPNIMILFDTSGSMREQIQIATYVYATTYDPRPDYALVVPLENRDTVYYYTTDETWVVFKNNIADVECSKARDKLTSSGHYEGYTNPICRYDWSKTYDNKKYVLRTGNYMNFLQSIGGSEYKMKVDVAKDVINDFIGTVNGVKLGLFVFNRNCSGCSREAGEEGGKLHYEIKSISGDDGDTIRQALIDAVTAINIPETPITYTPLAESLFEIGLYFRGGKNPPNDYGYFSPTQTYTSPIEFSCQKNYVIIMTDGEPTNDANDILNPASTEWANNSSWAFKIGDQDGDGKEPPSWWETSHYLDDVAKYFYNADLRSDLTGSQNIVTYTIGFTINNSLLEKTATEGHGKYYYCNNYQELADKFQRIIADILAKTTSFVAPIVPVSRMERTSAGDKIYLALFKPQSTQWLGNIKKYNVAQPVGVAADCPNDGSIAVGEILDSACKKALDSNGQFYPTSISCWSTSFDGGEVSIGGVGGVLKGQTRNLYTYFGPDIKLKANDNAFSTSNAKITPGGLGLGAEDTDGKNSLINYVYGYDAYDDNTNGNTTEKRDWILNSFLHSRPLVVHYGPSKPSIIYVGSNSGMLHAFNDSDGSERWGFIPPNLLSKLHALHGGTLELFVDSSPRAYLEYDTVSGDLTKGILIFGQRRGGNCYYALDISDYNDPKYLWHIDPNTMADFSEMGQSWSSPVIGKVGLNSGDKWVAFLGGGYDTNQDNDPIIAADLHGRGIYIVGVEDGSLVKRFSVNDTGYADMTYSIPSDIAKLDTDGNGKVDRLYVGDTGGRIWRFDISDPSTANWTGKIIFKSNPTPPGANDRRKMFYPPDVTLEADSDGNYEMLFFGTGDREAPKEDDVSNRLYALKDKNPDAGTPYEETANLVDVTNGVSDASELEAKNGWLIILEYASEKALSAPVAFYKTVYYTTFTASAEGQSDDPCYVGEGTARLYAVKYFTGDAAFNLDGSLDNVISKSDRSEIIGTAIPSNVIITFIGGTAVAYTGVGGGIVSPSLSSTRALVPTAWRIVF